MTKVGGFRKRRVFMTLVVLKHGFQFDFIVRTFIVKASNFERMTF